MLLVGPIDEYAVTQLREFDSKKIVFVSKEDLEPEEEEKEPEDEGTHYEDLCKVVKDALGDKFEKIVLSNYVTDLPCVLATGQFRWSTNMERISQGVGPPGLVDVELHGQQEDA